FKRIAENRKNEEAAARRRAYVLCGSRCQVQDHERTTVHMSQHFVYRVDGAVGTTVACGHRDDAIQERIRRVGGLEAWRRTKIVECRIDGLAARDRGDHLRRAVTQAERLH